MKTVGSAASLKAHKPKRVASHRMSPASVHPAADRDHWVASRLVLHQSRDEPALSSQPDFDEIFTRF
jgi:hypothetical protein